MTDLINFLADLDPDALIIGLAVGIIFLSLLLWIIGMSQAL